MLPAQRPGFGPAPLPPNISIQGQSSCLDSSSHGCLLVKRWGKGRRPFVEGFLGLIGKVIQLRTCHARSIMTHLVIIHPHKFDTAQSTLPAQVSQGSGGVFTLGEGNESSPDHGRVGRESLAFTALDRPAFCVHLLPFPVQFTAS